MNKRHSTPLLICLACLALTGFAQNTPNERIQNKDLTRDNQKLTAITRSFTFPNATLNYTITVDQNQKLVQQKWGDFFFGLNFGSQKRIPGGWDAWNIMNLCVLSDGLKDVIRMAPPVSCTFTHDDQAATLALTLKAPKDPQGRVKLFLRQLTQQPQWLFIHVNWDTAKLPLYLLRFNSYPGATSYNGKRQLTDGNNLYDMSNAACIEPDADFILTVNRENHQRAGVIILMNRNEFGDAAAKHWGEPVTFDFYAKPTGHYTLGLSYYTDQNPQDVARQLHQGDAKRIKSIMNHMTWD